MKTWDGATLKPCACGADSWESLDDTDHDDGTCAVYRCTACKRKIHIELPD